MPEENTVNPAESGTPTGPEPQVQAEGGESTPEPGSGLSKFEVEFQGTEEDFKQMFQRGVQYDELNDKFHKLQTEYGRMSNEVGTLRKQSGPMPQSQSVAQQPTTGNVPTNLPQFTDDDLADPEAFQKKLALREQALVQNVVNTVKGEVKGDIDELRNSSFLSQADQIIADHPILKMKDKTTAYSLFDAAVTMANSRNASHPELPPINSHKEAVEFFFGEIMGGRTVPQSTVKATQQIIKNVRKVSGGGGMPPMAASGGPASNASNDADAFVSMSPADQNQFVKNLSKTDPGRLKSLQRALADRPEKTQRKTKPGIDLD